MSVVLWVCSCDDGKDCGRERERGADESFFVFVCVLILEMADGN